MHMEGQGGVAATIAARAADVGDKDVPWITISITSTGSNELGRSFAIGLGSKIISKVLRIHLDHESTELARRVTQNLPWGPGPYAAVVASTPAPPIAAPEIKMPEPPSFGYMDWEGKRDFSAVVFSTSFDKARNDTLMTEMPMAMAGDKVRLDMDRTKMMKGDSQSPLSKISVIQLGDKKIGYTLYPNARKYMVRTEKQNVDEKPQVEKIKVDSEAIDGHPTEKFKVKIIYTNGKVEEGFIWNAIDLGGMTIKSEVENKDYRVTTELKDIITETPPLSTFEIPEGYTEAQSFMELMAGDQKK
jgi:hypothetical protein